MAWRRSENLIASNGKNISFELKKFFFRTKKGDYASVLWILHRSVGKSL